MCTYSLIGKALSCGAVCVLLPCTTLAQTGAPQGADSTSSPTTPRRRPVALEGVRVLGTAEEEIKQAPGVSTITAEDIAKRPPANDLSELIRTMPGVNLTGNSSTGAFGNNRQIDLRGMGPENTMILIDGKPVKSKHSVRMGRNGERNSRGDSNWVPADAIARIEVLRGPAAARYGSGASGGVINIVTKRPSDRIRGSITAFGSAAQNKDEGATRRVGFTLSGPLAEKFSFRLYGNLAQTNPDKPSINAAASGIDPDSTTLPPAGREGVKNRDISGMLRYDLSKRHVFELESSYSRQGNMYAGERLIRNGNAVMVELVDAQFETNTMHRRSGGITYRGRYDGNKTSRAYIAFENTSNTRLNEGLFGGGEGTISTNQNRSTTRLKNIIMSAEYNVPANIGGIFQTFSVGVEHSSSKLDDPYGTAFGISISGDSTTANTARMSALYLEDNIGLSYKFTLTPGVRFDHHNLFGGNLSPSLNASYAITQALTIKGGIARAFKAPNLYQSNPNYLYQTRGNGCPYLDNGTRVGGPCYIFGNRDLDPETSVNKEIGIGYHQRGWNAGLTYFHNDYQNKIIADMGDQEIPDTVTIGGSAVRPFKWVNAGAARVQGIEGNLNIPLYGESGSTLKVINNVTSMLENKNIKTGQPLSIIPKYTLNSMIEWNPTSYLSIIPSATVYGRQKPPTWNASNNTDREDEALAERGSYTLFGLNGGIQIGKTALRIGVSNLGNKRLFRESNNNSTGAATYNEPGRVYYLMVTQRI